MKAKPVYYVDGALGGERIREFAELTGRSVPALHKRHQLFRFHGGLATAHCRGIADNVWQASREPR